MLDAGGDAVEVERVGALGREGGVAAAHVAMTDGAPRLHGINHPKLLDSPSSPMKRTIILFVRSNGSTIAVGSDLI